jgi:hypothetical protein
MLAANQMIQNLQVEQSSLKAALAEQTAAQQIMTISDLDYGDRYYPEKNWIENL